MNTTKEQIITNIKELSKKRNKTLEGIIYYNNNFKSYVFSLGVRSIALVLAHDKPDTVTVFKCTATGKITLDTMEL